MSTVIWHEVECGGYTADLALWEELATTARGAILDLGCGAGRVALHLARQGHEVQGLDWDSDLVAAFNERAELLPASAATADARDFSLDQRFGLAIAPMQLVQLLGSGEERVEFMHCVAKHLDSGGQMALAIVDSPIAPASEVPLIPDAREVDGWIYSSLPLDAFADRDSIVVRRLRQTVSPDGELKDEIDNVHLHGLSVALLEQEGQVAGLRPVGRREVPATEDHVGSTVVLLEVAS